MSQANSRASLEDAFIKVTFEEDSPGSEPAQTKDVHDPLYISWLHGASAQYSDPALLAVKNLKNLYSKHSLVLFTDFSINILSFPGALVMPLAPSELLSSVVFIPYARSLGSVAGVLVDQIKFGSFRVAWNKFDFIVYIVRYPFGLSERIQHYILHEGPESHSRALLLAAGAWFNALHEEVYVFNGSLWEKDHSLWVEVQKANWDDVILKDSFKTALKKDVYGFFSSEDLYKNLSIPWKRGLIMYGPPGNGKTISLKAIMKYCDAIGYAPLYVKTFKGWRGEEGAMAAVFEKAREMAPCVIILEDLDSLINDQNRSFFLNQIDGLEGNDGLLVIGSTNHYDRLDPALSGRPSRFDRKFLFPDPDFEERTLYAKYWQDKLQSNKSLSFPDSLVTDIANATEKFSFAYLKEAFISTLVLLAGYEDEERPSFASILKGQIVELRSQIGKDPDHVVPGAYNIATAAVEVLRQDSGMRRVDSRLLTQDRIWDAREDPRMSMPGEMPVPEQRSEPRGARPVLTVPGRSFIY